VAARAAVSHRTRRAAGAWLASTARRSPHQRVAPLLGQHAAATGSAGAQVALDQIAIRLADRPVDIRRGEHINLLALSHGM
jgi:hypothetical protein